MLEIETWRRGAGMAYSVIYEYGLASVVESSLPVHQEFMVPANVAVVAGRIGQIHNLPGSPYHMTQRLLDAGELEFLLSEGWTVSSRGMTCEGFLGDLEREVLGSRATVESVLGRSVAALVLGPTDRELVRIGACARQNGYLCMFSCLDYVNLPADDLFCLGRVSLTEEGPGPWRRRFDPFDRLMLAKECRGWVVDCLVCASAEPSHLQNEISLASLARRFEKVREVGGGDAWCAVPEEIVDYTLTRRATRVVPGKGGAEGNEYIVEVDELPPSVERRTLTFRASGLRCPGGETPYMENLSARARLRPFRSEKDFALFDMEVFDGMRLRVPDL